MLSKLVIFLDFRLAQGSVYSNILQMRLKSLCFLTNQLVKEFLKSVHICQSYQQTSSGILCRDTVQLLLEYVYSLGWKLSGSLACLGINTACLFDP